MFKRWKKEPSLQKRAQLRNLSQFKHDRNQEETQNVHLRSQLMKKTQLIKVLEKKCAKNILKSTDHLARQIEELQREKQHFDEKLSRLSSYHPSKGFRGFKMEFQVDKLTQPELKNIVVLEYAEIQKLLQKLQAKDERLHQLQLNNKELRQFIMRELSVGNSEGRDKDFESIAKINIDQIQNPEQDKIQTVEGSTQTENQSQYLVQLEKSHAKLKDDLFQSNEEIEEMRQEIKSLALKVQQCNTQPQLKDGHNQAKYSQIISILDIKQSEKGLSQLLSRIQDLQTAEKKVKELEGAIKREKQKNKILQATIKKQNELLNGANTELLKNKLKLLSYSLQNDM